MLQTKQKNTKNGNMTVATPWKSMTGLVQILVADYHYPPSPNTPTQSTKGQGERNYKYNTITSNSINSPVSTTVTSTCNGINVGGQLQLLVLELVSLSQYQISNT